MQSSNPTSREVFRRIDTRVPKRLFSHPFPGGSEVKACLECRRPGFDPWVGKIPWRRKWQPTPALLPGESHGGRSLVGSSPWGRKESDTTERLHSLTHKGVQPSPQSNFYRYFLPFFFFFTFLMVPFTAQKLLM